MYLESITIKNYRKFRTADNIIHFVKPTVIDNASKDQQESIIAPSTTLIIGKNNAGKTTVVNALTMLCNNRQPLPSDFNTYYLNSLFGEYALAYKKDNHTNFENLEVPYLEFTLKIKVNFEEEDQMTHLSSFISISERCIGKPVSVKIKVKIILTEESSFKEKVADIFKKTKYNEHEKDDFLQQFHDLLNKDTSSISSDGNLFDTQFINLVDEPAQKFSLKKLINIKEIKANRHLKDGVLSEIFNKIVAFQFANDDTSRNSLESGITQINEQIAGNVSSKSDDISKVLGELESSDKVDLRLSGNVTYDTVLKGLIKYNFIDDDEYIPEDQFGLGYINLLNIIGEIIHFVDSYEDQSHLSRINMLFIEEPEAFMHPQMQEFFIKRIDNAVSKALDIANNTSPENKRVLQCQIAITTHSSHIVNSKIHSSNTFNNLNYLTSINKCTKAISLTDVDVVPETGSEAQEKLNFIKKHIKYKVSELFFSDAIIFVEGITEETLLNYYIEKNEILKHHYISVFNINGAHGKLYLPLAKKLCVPALIVTDLDIKRDSSEKGEYTEQDSQINEGPCYTQVTDLKGRATTNATLKEFNEKLRGKNKANSHQLDDIEFFYEENLCVVFQKDAIRGQYATSLEEAFILTNYDNKLLNETLKLCKPQVYDKILKANGKESTENLIYHSYELQKKLSNSKSELSNQLLYKLLAEKKEDNIPSLPNYLETGLSWLAGKLAPSSAAADLTPEVLSSREE